LINYCAFQSSALKNVDDPHKTNDYKPMENRSDPLIGQGDGHYGIRNYYGASQINETCPHSVGNWEMPLAEKIATSRHKRIAQQSRPTAAGVTHNWD
jgi:hypothetical protein